MGERKFIKKTLSVCPVCYKRIPADIVEEDGKIMYYKTCPEHGEFKEVYWGDAELYYRFAKYLRNGKGVANPQVKEADCPYTCGLCPLHMSNTALGLIDVTNRCNLNCWYCFANAQKQGYIYEPSLEQIEKNMDEYKNEKPIAPNSVMLAGGEPTMRDDLPEIVRMARKKGFGVVFIATNGIKIAESAKYTQELKDAGTSCLYVKYNGTTPETNFENLKYIPDLIENCRKAHLAVVLVPTIIRGYNDQEVWPIVKYALKNVDIVRGVNFQPIAFTGGALEDKQREQQRYTIPDLIIDLEKQSGGKLPRKAFYPVPAVMPLSDLAETLGGKKGYPMAVHPHCGAGTYLWAQGEDKFTPITEIIDYDGLIKETEKLIKEAKEGKKGFLLKLKEIEFFTKTVTKYINFSKVPDKKELVSLIFNIGVKGDFDSIVKFDEHNLFIGIMHFQDPYNIDLERLKRCSIHYITPDNKIIPFCAYNSLRYRDENEQKFRKPLAKK